MTDSFWMDKALELAKKGEGKTCPNPPVGCVIVRENKLIGQGYHKQFGGAHAEIIALKDSGPAARGAVAYVTLEPCSTHGKTGCCVNALIESGIARVVTACIDPNLSHKGRGLRILKNAGILVTHGVCQTESEKIITPFKTWICSGRPFITLKLAITLDGKIADRNGRSKWITSKKSKKKVQELRKRVDAIIVGRETVKIDNPALTCRPQKKPAPYRVVTDSKGLISLDAKLLNDAYVNRTIVATTSKCPVSKQSAYRKKGADVWVIQTSGQQVSLRPLMKKLAKKGILHALCEGGGILAANLVKLKLVDEYIFFIAPIILGGQTAKKSSQAIAGIDWGLNNCPSLQFNSVKPIGNDLMITATPSIQRQ